MPRGKRAQRDGNRLPGNEDHHRATSGEESNLRLASILPPKSVQVIPEQPSVSERSPANLMCRRLFESVYSKNSELAISLDFTQMHAFILAALTPCLMDGGETAVFLVR
jgi:hypothetical protein